MIKCGSKNCSVLGDWMGLRSQASIPRSWRAIELHATGRCGAAVREVDNFALTEPINCGVRLFDETLEAFRQPMIPASLPALAVHPLLNHDPLAVIGHDEAVQ
jgi:hypothetical protein